MSWRRTIPLEGDAGFDYGRAVSCIKAVAR
jgi:hypothetical protein